MPDDGVFCPYCGRNNQEEPVVESIEDVAAAVEKAMETDGEAVVVVPEEAQEQSAEGSVESEILKESTPEEEAQSSAQIKKMKRTAIISGCIAALAVLATVLFFGITKGGWDVGSWFDWLKPRENNIYYKDSYSVSDRKAFKKREEVVAAMGDSQLTNGQLQIYYWMQVYDFIEQNGYYLSYMGFDLQKPLDEQQSYDKKSTWQQYLLKSSLQMWQSNQAFAMLAEENGYQLDAEYQKKLDNLLTDMEEEAKKKGFESVNAMLQKEMGPGCTQEDYLAYMETYYKGYTYFGKLYKDINPTEAEVDAYFKEHQTDFLNKGIAKGSGNYYDVRHIMIAAEGGKKDDKDNVIYSEEEWAECLKKAEKVLEEWKSGKLTEEAFGALAEKHSDDKNTKNKGGLLLNLKKEDTKTLFGEAGETWCADENRKAGDYELVKGKNGYHIIYFVESEAIWYAHARSSLVSELGQKLVQETIDKYDITIDYKKIVLGVVPLGK